MISDIKIIDVTLRDGGYRNSFHYSEGYIDSHIESMSGAGVGVDWIEIEYQNGSAK